MYEMKNNRCICFTDTPAAVRGSISAVTAQKSPAAPRSQTSPKRDLLREAGKVEFVSAPGSSSLDDLDTMLLNVEVSHVLIGSGRLSAVPPRYFLHPSVMHTGQLREQRVWPERISNSVCAPRDNVLSETLISCIS